MMKHIPKGTVEFENVSKRYRLGTLGTLRGTVSAMLSRGKDRDNWRRTLWALRDVSFRVEPGASLGLIGPNGAGKTTTLKLLSNITRPTSGRIAVHGRVSALIELGAGFHPELTGRENVYLNGAILGLRRQEITRKLDAIIAFSGLERYIDTPVKRYSSGMYVRLGFAVAAHVEPDILLVDEVLAVGDASFRHRCIQHMRELQHKGTSVIFVSHNMHLVRNMCDAVLLMMHGQIQAKGKPADVIAEYEQLLFSGDSTSIQQDGSARPSFGEEAPLILTAAEVESADLGAGNLLASDLPAKLRIYYKAAAPQQIGRVDVRMHRDDGTLCSTADSSLSENGSMALCELSGNGVIEVIYDPLQLTTGRYVVSVQITEPSDSLVIASVQSEAFYVHAEGSGINRGVYVPRVSWMQLDLRANTELTE